MAALTPSSPAPWAFPHDAVKDLIVIGEDEKPVPFGSLYTGPGTTVIYFSRHFG